MRAKPIRRLLIPVAGAGENHDACKTVLIFMGALESKPLIKSPCRTDFHDAEVDGLPRARRFFDQRTNGIAANPLSLEARSQIKSLEKKGSSVQAVCNQPTSSAATLCRASAYRLSRPSPRSRAAAEGEISRHRWTEDEPIIDSLDFLSTALVHSVQSNRPKARESPPNGVLRDRLIKNPLRTCGAPHPSPTSVLILTIALAYGC